MVFFNGTLQEGISTALQQSKLVVCFVTDDKEESKIWEMEFLSDEAIAPSLEKHAVVLRLEAGSQEAGYLAAIFPLPKTPTLVIIKNGEMKEYISAGTLKNDFVSKVSVALSTQSGRRSPTNTPPPSTAAATALALQEQSQNTTAHPTSAAPSAPATQTQTLSTPSNPNFLANDLLVEAERRRNIARKEREAIEKERRRKAEGKKPAAAAEKDPKKEAVKKAAQQLAERQRQARGERARVLKRIEDDKAERRARQELTQRERFGEEEYDSSGAAAASSPVARVGGHDQCAVQVRLFDGSTIRTRFEAKATLAKDVREWIDESRTDGNQAYAFKVILTPLPNRSIDYATEEEQNLEELGLAPSATLVLTPVDRYSEAYMNVNAERTKPVLRVIATVLSFLMTLLGGVAGALGGLGSGANAVAAERGESSQAEASQQDRGQVSVSTATGRDGAGRIKGFQNPIDRKKQHQLYNGNSARKDDDDYDDKDNNTKKES